MNILSFDVGGTSIKYGIVNEHSEIKFKDSINTPSNEDSFLEIINPSKDPKICLLYTSDAADE